MSSDKEFLKERRKKLGLTQKQVAEKIGVLQQYYCKCEQRKHVPNIMLMDKIARALKIGKGKVYTFYRK